MDSCVSPEDEIWFLRVCRHISNAVYQPGVKPVTNHHQVQRLKLHGVIINFPDIPSKCGACWNRGAGLSLPLTFSQGKSVFIGPVPLIRKGFNINSGWLSLEVKVEWETGFAKIFQTTVLGLWLTEGRTFRHSDTKDCVAGRRTLEPFFHYQCEYFEDWESYLNILWNNQQMQL